jgi:hypothetical protein
MNLSPGCANYINVIHRLWNRHLMCARAHEAAPEPPVFLRQQFESRGHISTGGPLWGRECDRRVRDGLVAAARDDECPHARCLWPSGDDSNSRPVDGITRARHGRHAGRRAADTLRVPYRPFG